MGPIYRLPLMLTTKLNIVIGKATYHKMLWVCVPLIISFNTFLLVGKGLQQIVVFLLLLCLDQIH